MPSLRRTHTCSELRDSQVGESVVLNGWVNTARTYNDQVFIDLRDRYGLTQVVAGKDSPTFAIAREVGREFCLAVKGTVAARLPGKEKPSLATGKVEVKASE